ncbi:DUF441 domain-containing protein [Lactobacillus sp. DCY120]|uniref:UPF0756 membrane protein HU830_00800 n=1 Tax=Bombilactobacillus apium TaxID=2675299 RepID=A0A850RA94_9LACO|nr:DUF441 domain-containing protein [Bombilactobacillus apium]NVY95748.1 DUF441 domain-containing protein [Bombilactobacillus apium]
MESWLFLLIILLVATFSKNRSLQIAAVVTLILKLIPQTDKLMQLVQSKGINWGVTVISLAILMPIALGQIGFQDLLNAFKSPAGYVAVGCGILVAILSAKGVGLLTSSPEMTVALVLGTIIGVVCFRGIAAGPVIASGMTYCIVTLLASWGIK